MESCVKNILAGLLFFVANSCFAAYMTGNDILPICKSAIVYLNNSTSYYLPADYQNYLACTGYFEGASDDYFDTLFLVNKKGYKSLAEQIGDTPADQLIRMFTNYLDKNSKYLNLPASALITMFYGSTYTIPAASS
jgi:hypothetical protein